MNDKIKALLNVCGMPNEDLMDIYTDTNKSFYIKNFAELIIKECVSVIGDGDGSMSSMAEHTWRETCQAEINSHFEINK